MFQTYNVKTVIERFGKIEIQCAPHVVVDRRCDSVLKQLQDLSEFQTSLISESSGFCVFFGDAFDMNVLENTYKMSFVSMATRINVG